MKIIDLPQGSPEWLEWRRGKRMASEASIVTGRNPWQKALQLARVKRGLATVPVNAAMARGTAMEGQARAWFEAETGLIGDPCVIELGDYGASLDWMNGNTIAEFKVPQSEDSNLWKTVLHGEIPDYYQDQLTQQIAVSGAEKAYFCAYLPEQNAGRIIEYKFSPARWASIQAAWEAFWATYMVGDLPEEFRTDSEWLKIATLYSTTKAKLDKAQAELDDLKAELIRLAGEQSAKGCGITLTRVETSGAVKWAEVAKALNPPAELVTKFTGKPAVSYKVTLAKD